jgi:Na+/proline symporter
MIVSAVVSLAVHPFIVARYPADDQRIVAVTMLVTIVVSTIVWLAVTYMTKPEPDETLDAFYLRVRPGGPGWRHISERLGFGREGIPGGSLAWTNWIAGIIAVYASLFGIGKIVFGEIGTGIVLLVIAVIAFAWIARSFRNEVPPPAAALPLEERMAAD